MNPSTAPAVVASPPLTASSSLAQIKGLLPFLKPYRWQMLLATVALVMAATTTLLVPLAFRQLVDFGFKPEQGVSGAALKHVDIYFLALLGLASVLAVATAARFYMVSWLGERVTSDLRSAIYAHVIRQSPAFFETTQTGEVLSRLTTDTTLIQTLIGTSLSMGLRNALLFLGGLVMLFLTSFKLAALILLLLVAVVVPIVLLGRRVRKLSRQSQDRIADASALAGERLNASTTVQAFAREAFEAHRFSETVERAFSTAIKRIRARSLLTVFAILLVFAAIVFVLWLGAHAVVRGEMSGGVLAQFILYAVIVAGSIGALSEVMGDVQRAAGATERLLELLHARSAIESPNMTSSALAENLDIQINSQNQATMPKNHARAVFGHDAHHSNENSNEGVNKIVPSLTRSHGATLQFNAVNFSYPSRPETLALNQLDLHVAAGETVALVGASGAGKTTLFQLLLRFYDPQSGSIELDGIDIRSLQLENLRTQIGIVPQDTVIFSDNALENIRYGRADASDAEVMAAAQAAAAHEFIERLPQGYQSFLGERGVRLSGGQKQRIAIARALLKNPPLLLLDEATSALDAESEQAVQSALEAAMVGRTTLIIAHRLATVQRADRIIVLENGQIIETGTHASLIQQSGKYARLAALQFKSISE